jgi:hypothetical protein
MVNVRVHFAYVVKIAMGDAFLGGEFSSFV